MTKDEMQKMLEFVAQRQEQFADNMQQAEARMNRFEGAFVGIFALTTENAKAIKELTIEVKELKQAQAQTDERVNVLINVIERFITAKSDDDKPDSEKE